MCVPVWGHLAGHRCGGQWRDLQLQHAAPDPSGVAGSAGAGLRPAAGGGRVLEGSSLPEEREEGGRHLQLRAVHAVSFSAVLERKKP